MKSFSAFPGPASSLPTARSAKSATPCAATASPSAKILPAAGLGRFSLKPNQQEPLNAYVPLDWLQERLEQPGKVNALLLEFE